MNNEVKNLLLLIGSPQGDKSTSNSLAQYILDNINRENFQTDKLFIPKELNEKKDKNELITKVNKADLIILSYPLYVDTPPASVINAFEFIEENIQMRPRKFIAIGNCGYPKASGIKISQQICKNFTEQTGMEWLGSLSLGKGAIIMGKHLEKSGFIVNKVKNALDILIKAIEEDKEIPTKADQQMKLIMPDWLYVFVVNNIMRFKALRNGSYGKYKNNPYKR